MYIAHQSLEKVIAEVLQYPRPAGETLLLLLAEQNKAWVPALREALQEAEVPFVGGFFPKLIYGSNSFETGILLERLPVGSEAMMVYDLDQAEYMLPTMPRAGQYRSLLLLVDGLTPQLGRFLTKLYDSLGNFIPCFGGGAGSLSLERQPCLFSNDGFVQDAALCVFLPQTACLGVKHGWKMLEGPFLVSSAAQNTVRELNWVNAFEVYQSIIARHTQQELTTDNFFDLAKGFPFGIGKYGQEFLIRDPIKVNEARELVCVGEVPENVTLSVMQGEAQHLIEAARLAVEEGMAQAEPSSTPQSLLIFDCISRSLFLEADFSTELEAVCEAVQAHFSDLRPKGALTLGEIASNGQGVLEFLNKTIVTALLYEEIA